MDLMVFGNSCAPTSANDGGKSASQGATPSSSSTGGGGGFLGGIHGRQQEPPSHHPLWLHRTLAAATAGTTSSSSSSPANGGHHQLQQQQQLLAVLQNANAVRACWRPDGRLLAVVSLAAEGDEDDVAAEEEDASSEEDGGRLGRRQVLSLYHVEEMMTPSSTSNGGAMSGGTAAGGGDAAPWEAADADGRLASVPVPLRKDSGGGAVVALKWSLVGRLPPPPLRRRRSSSSAYLGGEEEGGEEDDELPWTYQRRYYVDRSPFFVPGMGADNGNPDNNATVLPASRTPLSVVSVVTAASSSLAGKQQQQSRCSSPQLLFLQLYLHGRYHVLKDYPIPCPELLLSFGGNNDDDDDAAATALDVVVDSNLTHVAIAAPPPPPAAAAHNDGGIQKERAVPLLQLMYLPEMARWRYELQQITALGCSIRHQLRQCRLGLQEIEASYRGSVKPLDALWEKLVVVAAKYVVREPLSSADNKSRRNSVDDDIVQRILLQYVVSGCSATKDVDDAPSSGGGSGGPLPASSILEIFFTTNPQLTHDQILMRTERSLMASLARVEQLYKRLIPKGQLLVAQTSELLALARTVDDSCLHDPAIAPTGTSRSNGVLLRTDPARELYGCASGLLFGLESGFERLVETRFVLRDAIAWLRAAGAQIRAHGTDPSSTQQENAKKKRVPQSLVNRVAAQLRRSSIGNSAGGSGGVAAAAIPNVPSNIRSRTEGILGLGFLDLLQDPGDEEKDVDSARDAETTGATLSTSSAAFPSLANGVRSIPKLLNDTSGALEQLLECPRQFMNRSVQCLLLYRTAAANNSSRSVRAATTRIGYGGEGRDEDDWGYFSPRELEAPGNDRADAMITDENEPHLPQYYRQWLVVAESLPEQGMKCPNTIRILALPLTSTPNSAEEDEYETDSEDGSGRGGDGNTNRMRCGLASEDHCWATQLILPDDYSVLDMRFYGDDGNSSLAACSSTENASTPNKERRQALALLVQRRQHKQTTTELWLARYDDCPFRKVRCLPPCPLPGGGGLRMNLDTAYNAVDSTIPRVHVLPFSEGCGPGEDSMVEAGGILYARTRKIRTDDDDDDTAGTTGIGDLQSTLAVTGSRGIGAVVTTSGRSSNNTTSIDLFDLEEDEEEDEEDDDDNMSTE